MFVRLVYFLVAPFIVIGAAAVLPMTAVILNFVLLIAGFIFIEAVRRSARQNALVARIAARQLAFADFYEQHPPKPFAYYVFYPLLAPYWLFNGVARREFGLYRGFTRLGVVLLLVFGAFDYALSWAPDIAFGEFFVIFFAVFILNIIILIGFMIPLAVTIVSYQLAGRSRSVSILLGAATLSISLSFLGIYASRDTIVTFPTVSRTRLRGEADLERAVQVQTAALVSVWQDIRDRRTELDEHGWLLGASRERARRELTSFYRGDEAACFQVRVWPADRPTDALLKCDQPRDKPTVWLAMTADGAVHRDAARLPANRLTDKPGRSDRAH